MFEFHYTLQDEDFILFNQHHAKSSKQGKKALLMGKIVVLIVCFSLMILFNVLDLNQWITGVMTIYLGAFSLIWLFFSERFVMRTIRKNVLKLKKMGRLPYHSDVTLAFDEEGLIERTAQTESKTNYGVLERVDQSDKAIYIYTSTVTAYMLPKSVFVNPYQEAEFLGFLQEKIDNAKAGR